jgi:hypothetical protein
MLDELTKWKVIWNNIFKNIVSIRDGRIILGWIFGKWDVGVWTGWG